MNIDREIAYNIKATSIRGRLAFGVSCVEQFAKEYDIKGKWIDRLVETLWEFTSSERFDEWEEKINDLNPYCILDSSPNNHYSDYPSLSKAEFEELSDFYSNLPKDFVAMIEDTIEIGLGNLYGATGKYSVFSFEPTVSVYERAISMLDNPPAFGRFTRSQFSEAFGWGNPIEKESFF